ncbi:MAG: Tyrosine-protein kinase EpsD [Myxococcaceae bacterium]|nr:Tyrosine-protein kinase EpsD [Myxococcaceae bacterium]
MASQTSTKAGRTGMGSDSEAPSPFVLALRTVRKHWAIIAACAFVAAGISLVYSKTLPRVYESETLLELDPNVSRPLGEKSESAMPMGAGASHYVDVFQFYETQYKIMTSSMVMQAAAREASLQSDFEYFGLKAPPAQPITIEQAGAVLRAHVNIVPVKNSHLVSIKVEDMNPKRARRLADAVAAAYIDLNLQKAISATGDSVVWLNSQVDATKKELESNENALHTFKEKNDLPSTSINESSNMVRLEMQDLNTALTHTRTTKQELLARHAELSKVLSDSADVLPASELLSSTHLQGIRHDYVEAVRVRRSLIAEGKGENHPQVKAVDQRVAETKTALLAEVKNIQGAVERDLAIITRQEQGEAALYDAAHKRAVDLNMKEIEYHRLDRARDQNEKLYAMLNEHMKDADLARMMKVNNVHVVEKAVEPITPIRPRVSVNVAVGVVIGLLIGLVLVVARDLMDSSLKTPEDAERVLGVTFLGLLPTLDGQHPEGRRRKGKKSRRPSPSDMTGKPELVVHNHPHSGLAEAARSIRTNLLFTNPDRPYRKLLVTSAAPSDGKTTVACSIAIALAQSGQRVCIIDCDLRRPRLHRIFDRAGDAGVTNVLVGDSTIQDVAQPTEIENLFCIPSGPTPPNPADLLHSDRFKKFIDDAAEHFDRIVIDSPPVVAVTDSAIISTLVDGTVFVVRAFSTTRAVARQGMRTLADVDAPVVGTVLNAVDLSRHEYSYYQYYYYKREGYASLPTVPTSAGPKDSSHEPRNLV